jgi:peptidoglycan/LPS O-acetylase OafA/YrhL
MRRTYRSDIDGLRAIAVLSVVLYHLDMPFDFNGFVGVDIFFVISGFLITGLIDQDLVAGQFSLFNFYLRRIKRIVPALFVVIFIVAVFGSLVMLPDDLNDLGKSAFTAVASLSNVYFWYNEDASYFARSSATLPLLHTWSLGVEEQFYLLWPLLLGLVYRIRRTTGTLFLTGVILGVSLILAEWLVHRSPSFSFFMLPTRAWELLTGSAIYFLVSRGVGRRLPGSVWQALAMFGAAAIGFALISPSAGAPFPGLNAAYSCLGAGLLILSGARHDTLVSRGLSASGLVAIGLVSYSLYLWHWPVLSFARYFFTELSLMTAGCSVVVFSALSVASYRYVELPFRTRQARPTRVLANYVAIPALVLLPLTFVLYYSAGLRSLIEQDANYLQTKADRDRYATAAFLDDDVCQSDSHPDTNFSGNACVVGASGSEPKVLLIGDSHAAHHARFFGELGESLGYAVRNLSVGYCPPVFGTDLAYLGTREASPNCDTFRARVREELAAYEVVILAAVWTRYFRAQPFLEDLSATVRELQSRDVKVILLGQIPAFPYFDRNCQLRNTRLFFIDCEQHASRRIFLPDQANEQLQKIASGFDGVDYYDIGDVICRTRCSPYRDGRPIYYDGGHISIYGSRLMAEQGGVEPPEFLRQLRQLDADPLN